MTHDPTQDAHSLGIALRLAQAQNRELRKQLSTATEALERIVGSGNSHGEILETLFAKQALAAIHENAQCPATEQGEVGSD